MATDVRFNIYMSLQYRNSHYEYQTISWFIFMIHIHDRNSYAGKTAWYWDQISTYTMKPVCNDHLYTKMYYLWLIVRRAGLLWSQRDFEWRWSVPLFKCLTVLEFSFILFDLCLLSTFFNFIMNYVPIVTFWIFTYHKIWILSITFCSIGSYWIVYFLACLEVSWRVVS